MIVSHTWVQSFSRRRNVETEEEKRHESMVTCYCIACEFESANFLHAMLMVMKIFFSIIHLTLSVKRGQHRVWMLSTRKPSSTSTSETEDGTHAHDKSLPLANNNLAGPWWILSSASKALFAARNLSNQFLHCLQEESGFPIMHRK